MATSTRSYGAAVDVAWGQLSFSDIRAEVDAVLSAFLDDQERATATPELKLFIDPLRDLLAAGGKRLRPVLCVTGWQAVSSQDPPADVFRLAASLELFHMFAVIHDDVMDKADARRGCPAGRRTLAERHAGRPDTEELGVNCAILLGDLALGWSYDLLDPGDQDRTIPWSVLNAMRTETLIGQYLDLLGTGPAIPDLEAAWQVVRYKTAKYSFERPLHLGALLAGATGPELAALSAYALPLGEAFQLRDDLLGLLGDPAHTGKSDLDDLRLGKHTVLIATAFRRATPAQADRLRAHFANPLLEQAEAQDVRSILIQSGAVSEVEQLIADRHREAVDSLRQAPFRPATAETLRRLAAVSVARSA
jgi:geranylgeranyl diphosphate synthase type I